MVIRLVAILVAVAGLSSAVAVPAAATAPPPRVPWHTLPMTLPSRGEARSAGSRPARWLVGARPTARTTALARRYHARPLRLRGVVTIPGGRARALAAALRRAGLLRYAEPDVALSRRSAFDTQPDGWARGAVVSSAVPPPPAGSASIAIVDDFVDLTNPDVGPQTTYLNQGPGAVLGPHGTEVASAAAGALNGTGVFGVFPSARILSYGAFPELSCSDVATGVLTAAAAGARVINLSLGSPADCFTLFATVEIAYGEGSLVVASAGNEFDQGNPVEFPAAYPHVLSVAALTPSLTPAFFSNANLAVDLAAPGVQVPLAVPLAFDVDGVPDGVTVASGTSFSAPMVAGAVAWIAAARPTLAKGQIADIMRFSATDLGSPGWDANTGYGLVNVARALQSPAPPADPLEPNDDIPFIDGTVFESPDRYLWRGARRALVRASIDEVEDPADVYRIRVPRHAAFKVVLRSTSGNADLFVFSRTARTVFRRGRLIARSRHSGTRADVVSVRNAGGAARAYIAVKPGRGAHLSSAYTLQVLRIRR